MLEFTISCLSAHIVITRCSRETLAAFELLITLNSVVRNAQFGLMILKCRGRSLLVELRGKFTKTSETTLG